MLPVSESTTPPAAKAYLVGAGPGDPGLLSLRGAACLARADLVLYDYLVDPQCLEHARPGAELVCLGRHGQGRLWSPEEVCARMVEAAVQGRTVVRLKCGDPLVFARGGEELAALNARGVPYEIVPGVTAGLAAASYAGLPATHRDGASAVALVTGHEDDAKQASSLDWTSLAKFPGTLIVYMGVTTVEHWSTALLAAGKPGDTPVVVVRRCSWPNQQRCVCRLSSVAETVSRLRLRPPVVFLIGDAAEETLMVDWFAARPLAGRRVLVTRAAGQAGALRDRLQELGAEVRSQPAIHILPPESWQAVDAAIDRLSDFRWLAFSSANGVQAFFDRLHERGLDARRLAGVRLAAIGSGTAAELARYRLHADLMPEEYRAEALAEAIVAQGPPGRALLVRASRGREVLAERLAEAGAEVEQVVAYRSLDVETPDAEIAQLMAAGEFDWVTATSSAIARSLVRLFGDALRRTRLVSISPLTSQTLRELGHAPAAEAAVYTLDGVVEALLRAEQA